ncbi:MAG: M48 family metalloprotease [Alphaproteobacteria bacterium]|nr:M48 family metalloprotease [Alphaproteobacteria bacterium]
MRCLAKNLARTLIVLLALTVTPLHAHAGDKITFIRDAEIEHYLRELATPVYRAADIDPNSINIIIVKSNQINAFVAGGMNEFFYTGLLLQTETPEQLLGVMAHETGHITGGHLIRGSEAMKNASTEAIIGILVGVAAGIASGNGQATAAAVGSAQNIAERSFLRFSREQESSADIAAMSFLDRNGITSQGMLDFMKKLEGQELLPIDRQSEYVRTHPLTQDRISNIANHLTGSQKNLSKLDAKFYTMHERMKAKLSGYLQPEAALLRTTDKDSKITARYSRAVAFYQTSQLMRALSLVDGLIKEEPNNPYFHELKAQMLFDNGRIEEAVDIYKKVVDMVPDSGLLRISYGHALLESKNKSRLDLAIQQLLDAIRLEEKNAQTWRLLASAWGQKAELTKDSRYEGMAVYALAEEAITQGAEKEARQLADRALKLLPKGSPYWVKAQDIKLSTEENSQH